MTKDNNDNSGGSSSSQNTQISAAIATLKIPPFWSNRPDLWFLQVETLNSDLKASSQTKYGYLVSCLPSETMEIIADILKNPLNNENYEGLKEALLDIDDRICKKSVLILF